MKRKHTKLGACRLKPMQRLRPISFKPETSYVFETTEFRSQFTVYPDYNDQTRFVVFTEKQFQEKFDEE